MKLGIGVGIALAVTVGLVAEQGPPRQPDGPPDTAKEVHLSNVKQLTFGGENAEAYFSFDGKELIFQSMRDGAECDQIYAMRVDGTGLRRISSGEGRTTCSYFTPDGKHVVYASTYLGGKACPPKPDFSRGYVWPVYDAYDIFKANPDGSGVTRLTSTPGYDAEATIGPDGRIVFTSVRDGDMEIYSMNADGGDVKRLTNRPGPDGGPFFSRDGKQIVFRGRALQPGPELEEYKALLREGLWRPSSLEIFVMNADGSNLRQVTSAGGASFAPYFSPDGKKIIFSSNLHNPRGRDFELWLINVDGTGLERVTWNPSFDGFPMFSPDGSKLVFASNRQQKASGETNVFIADWRW
jgi:Tol biopolymer transport system component